MEISKEELESFILDQLNNAFAFNILTNEGFVITKYGDNYHMETSARAAEIVLESINKINEGAKLG